MRSSIRYILLLLLLSPLMAVGQSKRPVVRASIEPDSIRIGDCFTYTIEVERDLVQVTEFPNLDQGERPSEGMADIALVEELPIDTLSQEGRRLHLRKRYRLQAFDEGLIGMGRGAVLYLDKNVIDTLYGEDSLTLWVEVMQIDSAAMAAGLRDLKPQQRMPFKVGEVSGYVGWALLVIALLAVGIYLLKRYLEARGRHLSDLFKPAPALPPHVVAIRALEELHHRKLWQNGNFKSYYSELTEILRRYLAARYEVGAMEMTSDEIIEAMRELSVEELPKKAQMDLTTLLRRADLVKFAKAEPSAEENENSYTMAYYFVEETKVQEETPSQGEGIENM